MTQGETLLTAPELAQRILERVKSLLPAGADEEPLNDARLLFEYEKAVRAILDDCNRPDLPPALEMAIVEIALSQIESVRASGQSGLPAELDGRLKKIKMSEVEYELSATSGPEMGAAYIFARIQPSLSLYRRVKSL